jgi:pyrroloquinoline quinone biosynthesis protein D
MGAITEVCVPFLPRSVKLIEDRARGRWVLNAPERVVVPDDTALEILHLCDGERTVDAICDVLAQRYNATAATIRADVIELLQELADKGLLVARPPR